MTASTTVEVPEWADPEAVFAVWEQRTDDLFWLDAGPDASTGWSWVGTGSLASDEVVAAVPAGGEVSASVSAGPLAGGWVGWMPYDRAAALAGAPATEEPGLAAGRWVRADAVVGFDHAHRRVRIRAAPADLPDLIDLVRRAPTPVPPAPAAASRARARHTPTRYRALIAACREAIREGDAYQLCLTTRFDVDGVEDAASVYRRLRALTPAHHGGFIRIGDTSLLSASPEQFLGVHGGRVQTRPIKGTRPRGTTPDEDRALAADLAADPKERAENVMIVDLMRNDLSRVCEPGSVGVDHLLEVETYPAVHQLVSTVSGVLRPDVTVGALMAATFPAGSMTGAPKLSAMTLLHGLEAAPRGVYSGAFGWVGTDGALDLAMTIRSIVITGAHAYVGAGGGITWRSRPNAEVAEVGIKARGPLSALGAPVPDGW